MTVPETTTPSQPPTTIPPSPAPIHILVASTNPVKIAAAARAFARMFPSTNPPIAHGLSFPSGVPDQPFTDATTLRGAANRAAAARASDPTIPGGEGKKYGYFVGIEGGVDEHPAEDGDGLEGGGGVGMMRSFAWVVVLGRDGGKVGRARTGTYFLPEETAGLVRGGMELGRADEVVFGGRNTKQKNGSVGLLTGDVVDRAGYYEEAVVLALIPFREENRGLTF